MTSWPAEARRLHDDLGMPIVVIAEHWQVTLSQVRRYLDPATMEKSRLHQVIPRPVRWEDAICAYGPTLGRFLKPRHPELFTTQEHSNSPGRQIQHWLADDHRPFIGTIDSIVVPLGYHLSDLPECIWLTNRRDNEVIWHRANIGQEIACQAL